MTESRTLLPAEAAERKKYPVFSGVVEYFPAALVEISRVSYEGNQQHNPGQPLHHARGKSADHLDAMMRHLLERDYLTPDGRRLARDEKGMVVLAQSAWRLLAELQIALEAEGAPIAPRAK